MTKPRVKPLVWDGWDGGMTVATTPWGKYNLNSVLTLSFPTGAYRRYDTEVCAKAAAQADYEARILSALDQTPDPAVLALVDLLREARADLNLYVDADWPEPQRRKYPSLQEKWKRDMELCWRIDAALAAFDKAKENK